MRIQYLQLSNPVDFNRNSTNRFLSVEVSFNDVKRVTVESVWMYEGVGNWVG